MAESLEEEMADEMQPENNEDTVLSMVDVLQESEELEEEAKAVLGDSDDKYCTHPLGYRGRQALYSCATCTSASNESAGVCLACSYECHEGHQLYELYTKRNFRCDCGNSKFGSMQCKLVEKKDTTNPDNKYNQNFRGLYCVCSRPYPDPDDQIEDEMIQCVVCEDWCHGRHLGNVRVPDNNDYQEMVCAQCMQGPCDFLWYYTISSKEVKIEKEESCVDVEVENVDKSEAVPDSGNKEKAEIPAASDTKPNIITSDQKPAESQLTPDYPSTDTKHTKVPPTTENVDTEPSELVVVHQDSKDVSSTPTLGNAGDAAHVSGGDAAHVSGGEAAHVSGGEAAHVSGGEAAHVSGGEAAHVSGGEAAHVSGGEAAHVSGGEAAHVSGGEAAHVSGGEAAHVSGGEAAHVSGGEASTSAITVAATSVNEQRQQERVAGDVCRLRELKGREVEKKRCATFWSSGWRNKLCICQDCKMLYENRQVSFLMDEADTVLAYELRGKVKHAGTSQYQMGMEALTTLNRVQQVEVLHEYNDLKSSLSEYLQSFANQGKVVKRQDIDEFFSDMQSRKRQRVAVSNPQYFCR